MSADNNSNNNSREIDLLDLFQTIGTGILNFFKGIAKAIIFLVLFGVKNWYYMLALIALGIITGTIIFNISKPYYSSNMEAKTNGISSADMISYINNLQKSCRDGNSEALAIELEMHDTTASKIKDIQSFFIVDLNMDGVGEFVDFENDIDLTDTTQNRLQDRIYVAVEVSDNNAFTEVREGLLRYMRNNPYLLKLNEVRLKELKELIFQTSYELEKLDSLQNTDYFIRHNNTSYNNQSQMMFLAEKEPTMYYEYKFQLIEQKHKLQRELLLTSNAFTVIKDFTTLAIPENPKSMYVKKAIVYMFFLGFIVLMLIQYRGVIRKFIDSN